MRAQASLDFLLTYGWVLLIMAVALVAIFALGIFDAGSFTGSRAAGFAQLGVTGWSLSSSPPGDLLIKFKNNAGTGINITRLNATYASTTISNSSVVAVPEGGESGVLRVGGFSGARRGDSYSIRITVEYVDAGNPAYSYSDSGNLYGKVA